MHVVIHLSKPTDRTTPRVNLSVNYGLWVIMVCQCWLISCNKCITLVGDVHSRGESCMYGVGGYGGHLYTFLSIFL